MKNLGKLIAMAVLAVIFTPMPAQAGPGVTSHARADVTIGIGDASCTWLDAPTSANPPSALAIDLGNAQYRTCHGMDNITVDNIPIVSFDDPSGSATVDRIRITGIRLGISCTYEATNIALTGDFSIRDYYGTFTFYRLAGFIFTCPNTLPGTMTLDLS